MAARLQRIDRMTVPPVVGRFYLVPTIEYEYCGYKGRWPVMGPKHSDAEHLDFEPAHYHVDLRFIGRRQWRQMEKRDSRGVPVVAAGYPVSKLNSSAAAELPPVVIRRRQCLREKNFYPNWYVAASRNFARMHRHYAGAECVTGKLGLVCPHKKFSLGSISPDRNGIITCPLHGLRINAASGVVLPAIDAPPRSLGA